MAYLAALAKFRELMQVSNWLAGMAKARTHTHKKKSGGEAKSRSVKWGPTYQNIALRTLVAAFNWGKGQGLISSHCLQNPKAVTIRGRKRSRGQEAYIPPATWKKLIDCVGKSNFGFADILCFLHDTGCRPAEAYNVEARYYHAADRCIIYPGQPAEGEYAWKNARRIGKDRVIFLSEEIAKLVEEKIAKTPEGPLFHTKRASKWTQEAMSVNLRWYSKRLGITPTPTAYGFRHTYATDWLLNGGSIKVLADLIGTSISLIEKHYGHLMVDKERVRSIMTAVMKGRSAVGSEAVC